MPAIKTSKDLITVWSNRIDHFMVSVGKGFGVRGKSMLTDNQYEPIIVCRVKDMHLCMSGKIGGDRKDERTAVSVERRRRN